MRTLRLRQILRYEYGNTGEMYKDQFDIDKDNIPSIFWRMDHIKGQYQLIGVLDKSFMWLRIQYEDDKKVRNYWGIAGTYAKRIK
ncbi:hypothetical protein U9R71_20470 [Bacillus toyonensis]|uniref:hypothetical protein n=1 Tax=Bacillus toyonensis TaxID=155322 RepID=UPI003464FFA6